MEVRVQVLHSGVVAWVVFCMVWRWLNKVQLE